MKVRLLKFLQEFNYLCHFVNIYMDTKVIIFGSTVLKLQQNSEIQVSNFESEGQGHLQYVESSMA